VAADVVASSDTDDGSGGRRPVAPETNAGARGERGARGACDLRADGSVSCAAMSEQQAAAQAVDLAASVVGSAVSNLAPSIVEAGKASNAKLDEHQVVAYDLAHAAAAAEAARVMLGYAAQGELESMLAYAFIADAVSDIVARLVGREMLWGVDPATLAPAHDFVIAHRAPAFLEQLAERCAKEGTGPTHLGSDFELVAETFRRFADDKIRPAAEHVHRTNGDVPEDIIAGLAEIGGFGLS